MNDVSTPAGAPDRLEPHLFPPEPPPVETRPSAAVEAGEDFIYLADFPDSQAPAQDAALLAAAALIAHGQAQTPISIGLLGGAGSGKTSALSFLIDAAAARAQATGLRMIAVRVDAAEGAGEAETHIAARIYEALTASPEDGQAASLAREAVASLRDVQAVAREAADRLAEMRQNLETERRSLESIAGRRARLAETVLFETPGSRVDSYARAHRAKIEARLRSFGFEGDLIGVWKELVREMAERNPLEKFAACAQSLWAYRGQGRLLFFTILFALLAWGFGAAAATRASWIGWMKGSGGGPFAAFAGWLDAHASLLGTLQGLAILVAVLCLAADVVRAARFLNPIFRGASFLKIDLEARRRDVDALLAHQTRRVDLVTREVEAQARRAEDAERRAEGPRAAVSRSEELRAFYGDDDGSAQARARFAREFIDSLERVLARETMGAPRILVALDGFESLSAERAVAFLQAAGRLLARRGFAAVYAFDDVAAAALGADATARLARVFLIPLRLEGEAPAPADADANLSSDRILAGFDDGLPAQEIALLRALAPYAGAGPRDAKRFANVYRLARAAGGTANGQAAGALAVAILASLGAFATDVTARAEAVAAAAAAGFPVSQAGLDRAQPIASRFRPPGPKAVPAGASATSV